MLELMLLYIAASAVIGFIRREDKFGFWGWFFISIFLTPIMALILSIMIKKTES